MSSTTCRKKMLYFKILQALLIQIYIWPSITFYFFCRQIFLQICAYRHRVLLSRPGRYHNEIENNIHQSQQKVKNRYGKIPKIGPGFVEVCKHFWWAQVNTEVLHMLCPCSFIIINITHRILNESLGLIFQGVIFGRIFGLV